LRFIGIIQLRQREYQHQAAASKPKRGHMINVGLFVLVNMWLEMFFR